MQENGHGKQQSLKHVKTSTKKSSRPFAASASRQQADSVPLFNITITIAITITITTAIATTAESLGSYNSAVRSDEQMKGGAANTAERLDSYNFAVKSKRKMGWTRRTSR